MLANPILGELTLDDLNQRYRGTLVFYNSELRYCHGFDRVEGKHVVYLGTPISDYQGVFFDWKLLDTSRIPPSWVPYTDNIPAFFWYTDDRQFSRGYNARSNVIMWTPLTSINLTGNTALYSCLFNYKQVRHIGEKGREFLCFPRFKIYTPKLLLYLNNSKQNIWTLYYRNKRIGLSDGKCIYLPSNLMLDDVRETIKDTNVKVDRSAYEPLKELLSGGRRQQTILQMEPPEPEEIPRFAVQEGVRVEPEPIRFANIEVEEEERNNF